MKVCPNCSAEFEDQLKFCRQDGTALQMKQGGRACPICGEEVGSSSKFCRHCGASIESLKVTKADENLEAVGEPPRATNDSESSQQVAIEQAENYLKEENFREAISTLDSVVRAKPANQEARLLHLYATVKLYNVYGYEQQIDSLRSLSNLNEREREIVRELFVVRADAAHQRGNTEEAREYQRLATRVILGQPLIEAAPKPPVPTPVQPKPPEAAAPRISPQVRQQPQVNAGARARKVESSRSSVPDTARPKQRSSRLFISFLIVFGLAGLLAAGLLAHYAKKRGINIGDVFTSQPSATQQPGAQSPSPQTSPSGQVLAAEDLGFKVWGAGATDPNRQESVISERIGAQIADLRQLYQQEVQNKPELMGSIILQLTISPTGEVTKVEEYGARIRDDEFRKLVVNEVYKWRFSEANVGLTKVSYPLLFVPPKMDVATVLQWERSAGTAKLASPLDAKEEIQVASPMKQPEPRFNPGSSGPGLQNKSLTGTLRDRDDNKFANPGTRGDTKAAQPRPVTPVPSGSTVKPIIGQYEVLHPTSVYREPRDDSPMVARIGAGTKINVVDVRGEWLEVRSRQGNPPGFVKREEATPLGNR